MKSLVEICMRTIIGRRTSYEKFEKFAEGLNIPSELIESLKIYFVEEIIKIPYTLCYLWSSSYIKKLPYINYIYRKAHSSNIYYSIRKVSKEEPIILIWANPNSYNDSPVKIYIEWKELKFVLSPMLKFYRLEWGKPHGLEMSKGGDSILVVGFKGRKSYVLFDWERNLIGIKFAGWKLFGKEIAPIKMEVRGMMDDITLEL